METSTCRLTGVTRSENRREGRRPEFFPDYRAPRQSRLSSSETDRQSIESRYPAGHPTGQARGCQARTCGRNARNLRGLRADLPFEVPLDGEYRRTNRCIDDYSLTA